MLATIRLLLNSKYVRKGTFSVKQEILKKYQELYQKDLFETVLPFWVKYGYDRRNGGIDTCLTAEGKLFSAEKSVWMQGRGAWMFAHVCNVFDKNEEYAKMAKQAIGFSKRHCIDPKDGRMFFVVGRDGKPIRKRRYYFSEFFYIMANAEYYGLTQEQIYLDEARKYHKLVVSMWEDPANDPFKITPKFESTAPEMRGLCLDAVLMQVTRTLRIHDHENWVEYEKLEKKLITNIVSLQFSEHFGTLLENVAPDGSYMGETSSGRMVTPGHCMETAWYLLQEAEDLHISSLIDMVEKIYAGAMRWGWDKKYGGLLYFVDVEGYAPQAYEHDMKLWWVHTEALIAALKLYRITGKQQYWDDFVMLTDYVFTHFRDSQFGEWYGYLHRDGTPTEPMCKGNLFKGPFHVPRMYCEVVKELELLEK